MSNNKFLYDLLATMIQQHGEQNVMTQLTQLHAKMGVSDSAATRLIQKKKNERECSKCGGDRGTSGSIHYCM